MHRNAFYTLLLAMYLAFPLLLGAQGKEALFIDSLLKVLPSLPGDTNKVNILCNLSNTYYNIDVKQGFRRGNEALALAEKLGWQKGIAKAYASVGSNYWANSEYVKAQEYYFKSLKINESLGNKNDIAKSLHRLGVSYSTQADKSKPIIYFQRALQLFEECGDSLAALGCHLNIGQLYQDQNDNSKTLQHYNKALQIAELTKSKREYAFVLNEIGRAYALQKNYSKAVEYEERSIRAYENFGDNNELAMELGNAGEVFLMLQDYKRSLINFKRAIKIFTPVKNRGKTSYFGSFYGNIGKSQIILYKRQVKNRIIKTGSASNNRLLVEAINNLRKGLSICESVTAWNYSEDFNKALSEAYALQGNFSAAFEHLKISSAYKDSIFNNEQHDQMARLELEYEYGKKKDSLDYQSNLQNAQMQLQKTMSGLALKQQWLYSIFFIVLLCLVGFYFLFRYRVKQLRLINELNREKAEKQLKKTEYKRRINEVTFSALRSQMNPHFIFNALNTIQSYVYSNDKKSATNYLGIFSELIRKILDNSTKQKITLAEELHVLQLYIDIEKARFGDTFYADIDVDTALDIEDIFIPPMLIQPYAENAIKHGLLHISGEKKLLIRISKSTDNRYVNIIIDDNGIGREKSIEINKKRVNHHSFANTANKKRIDLINEMYDEKTDLHIIDKKNIDGTAAGTTIIISIPVQQLEPV